MSEREFLELLNLYLDGEIRPADMARLEAEIRRDPARHRRYRQYCRMRQGLRLLGTAETPAAAQPWTQVKARRRRRVAPVLAWGAVAAAAAVALVWSLDGGKPAPGALGGAAAPALAAAGPVPAEPFVSGAGLRPAGVDPRVSPGVVPEDPLAWVRDFRVVALEERPRVPGPPAAAAPAPGAPGGGKVDERATETAAFKFVK